MPDFNYINERTGGNEHLCARITEIVKLEYQLDHPKEQSWYFKSGLESQKIRLEVLTKKYESFRDTVNAISLEELAASLKIEQKNVSEAGTLNCSRGSRVMAHSISRNRINTIELYQSVKKDVGVVPELIFFRNSTKK